MTKRGAAGAALIALGLATTSVGFLSTTATAVPKGAPPGNNGTVKVENVLVDSKDTGRPENNPHLPCSFTVEWWNFEKGDFYSNVSFVLQAPTRNNRTMTVDGPSKVFIGEDPANGAGAKNGRDASVKYTLHFTGAPHPVQGFHVKLTTRNQHSQGADTKYKVFWVDSCDTPPSTTTPPPYTCPEGTDWVDTNENGVVEEGECVEIAPSSSTASSPPPPYTCPDGTEWIDTNENGVVEEGECVEIAPSSSTASSPPPSVFTCPDGFEWADLNDNGIVEEGECVQVAPTSATSNPTEPVKKPTKSTTPTVLPTSATSNPAVAPTAVDAGLPGGGDGPAVPSSLLILLGAAMAVLGLGIGFVPVVARGKHSH
ncbi:hypothetical protein [Nocardioides marmoribigeumensis]|uniref:hypothetical protein n=1 Tax=Nocardioides marmoribigeumensis TaxID=433649 RepID=UPI0031DEB700